MKETKPSLIWPCYSFISYAILQLILRPALYLLICLTSLYFCGDGHPYKRFPRKIPDILQCEILGIINSRKALGCHIGQVNYDNGMAVFGALDVNDCSSSF